MARVKAENQVARERERRGWELRLKGWRLARIAAELGCSEACVCKDLKRIEQRLAAEFSEQAKEIKARQTAQLEEVYRQAMAAWERSCEDGESESVVTGRAELDRRGNPVLLPDQITRTRKGQSGDARLLGQAMEALAAVRKIWGLDAPKEVDLTSGGEPIKLYAGIDLEKV